MKPEIYKIWEEEDRLSREALKAMTSKVWYNEEDDKIFIWPHNKEDEYVMAHSYVENELLVAYEEGITAKKYTLIGSL